MKVLVATVQVPFIYGGAEILAEGLVKALCEAGHTASLFSMPFRFAPTNEVKRSIDLWQNENLDCINGYVVDRVICLKFPTFYLKHPHKVAWLLHQHRAVYDLWDTPLVEGITKKAEDKALKREITKYDTIALRSFHNVFTIAKTVSKRLQHFNGIPSVPLYHPPKLARSLYNCAAEPYIFFPSRLETLKRQSLLIQGMALVKSPTVALLAGDGGQKEYLQNIIDRLNIQHKVRLLGEVTDDEMLGLYACCLGVFFGPYDEDYGYVTLEAMLAAKPVITCTDSGEPAEFVLHAETGFVVEPESEAIAEAIDALYSKQKDAAAMGRAGLERYQKLDISWDTIVQKLLD